MLIRAERKLYDPKFTLLAVHIWASSQTKVAIFHRDEQGNWKQQPFKICLASQRLLDHKNCAYIQGKLAKNFLEKREMRVNDKAQLVYRWRHPEYSKPVKTTI